MANPHYSLKEVVAKDERFCRDIYGKDFETLDASIQKDAGVFIPPRDGRVYLVGGSYFDNYRFNIYGPGSSKASRGIRVIKNSP